MWRSADVRDTGSVAMSEDVEKKDALTAAGYLEPRAAMMFCLVVALVGGLVGSVLIAILLNVAFPGIPELVSTGAGAVIGALLSALLGLLKIRSGNLSAREEVEDKEWRRQMLRQRGIKP